MREHTTRWITLAIILAAVGAAADDDVDEAEGLFQQAMRRYQASEYLEAARLFERAHAVHPHGDTIFNAGVSYLWAGDCESSRRAFGWYLNDAGAVRGDPRVRRAEQALDSDPYPSPERLCVLVVELRRAILETEEQGSGERAARLDARRMFELAEERYAAREYAEAARLYAVANGLVPHRDTVYNLGLSHQWAGNWQDSLRAFESYLADVPRIRADTNVRAAEAALDAEPYADGSRMCELLSRLKLSIAAAERSSTLTNDNEARRAFQLGREQYLRQQWSVAAQWFDCANALSPRADTAYNAGLAHWRAGGCTGGHRALGEYLAERTELVGDAEVAAAVAALEREVAAPDATECPSLSRLVLAIRSAERGGG